ncbi:MAG: hypothetical protein ACI3YD_03890 [Alloprevotella sp.]
MILQHPHRPTALLAGMLLAGLCLMSCQQKAKKAETTDEPLPAASTQPAEQAADSTIYGTSGEFGMSTFTLIADNGDTLNVTRTALDGTDGKVYGDLVEGQRYAMTTRDNGEAIGVLINLTQLEEKVKDYEICNGHLVIKGDTVDAATLLND